MKRVLALVLVLSMMLSMVGCGASTGSGSTSEGTSSAAASSESAESAGDAVEEAVARGSKIGIMCSPLSFGEENYRMVEKYIEEYGEDRFIIHTLPEDADMQTEITQAQDIAQNPDCDVLIINEAIGGCVAAMNAAKQINPDLLIFAINLNEEPREVASVADFACGKSMDAFMYDAMTAAKEKELEVVTFMVPADVMGGTTMVERMDAIEKYGKEYGIETVVTVLPNLQDSNARAAIEQAAKEDVYNKTNEYGDKVGFIIAGSFAYVPTLSAILDCGMGYLLAIGDPGPFTPAYCDVFGIVAPEDHVLDLEWTNKAISDKAIENGLEGRFGNWKFSFLSGFMAASIEYAMAYQAGELERDDYDAWMDLFAEVNGLTDEEYTYAPFEQDGTVYDNCLLVTGATMFYGEDLGVE